MFEPSVCESIGAYVYALIHPVTKQPFYIGKGNGNRVFAHAEGALDSPKPSEKNDLIIEILRSGLKVDTLILRHGMTDTEAFHVEAALIDFCTVLDLPLTNLVSGHYAHQLGAMTTDEIIRRYQAKPLDEIEPGFVLININKTYRSKAQTADYCYEATKELWAISPERIPTIKYALAEYKGFIIAVYKINEWYSKPALTAKGKPSIRWGFNGEPAEKEIQDRYLRRSVLKRLGSTNPIRYNYKRVISGAQQG